MPPGGRDGELKMETQVKMNFVPNWAKQNKLPSWAILGSKDYMSNAFHDLHNKHQCVLIIMADGKDKEQGDGENDNDENNIYDVFMRCSLYITLYLLLHHTHPEPEL